MNIEYAAHVTRTHMHIMDLLCVLATGKVVCSYEGLAISLVLHDSLCLNDIIVSGYNFCLVPHT